MKKKWKIAIFFFFLMPAIIKWSPKVLAMKKIFNQCLLGLKQPKICEKCHFYATFKPFFGFWHALAIWIWNGYSSEILNFWLQNMKKKHAKVHWITLHSPGNGFVIPLIFHVLPQTSQETQILKKKDGKSWIFDSGTLTQIVSDDILS